MQRRTFLGTTTAILGVATAGCLGDGQESLDVEGTEVPLVPVDEAIEWYESGDTEFLDARPERYYEEMHIEGAHLSTYPDGLESGDPTEEIDQGTRIVTYCTCPHHQAGLRAASLLEEGYEDVHALDEGFREWYDREHPVAGNGNSISELEYHESTE